MKTILTKTEEGYALFIGEKGSANREFIATTDGMYVKYKLSKENCDEIFGVIDVEKLAKEYVDSHQSDDFKYTTEEYYNAQIDFKEGFNKAMKLNENKLFTLEDMRQAYDDGMNNIDADGCVIDDPDEDFIDTLKCIQQPTEIEVEIEMGSILDTKLSIGATSVQNADHITITRLPKLDKDGCLILKKL